MSSRAQTASVCSRPQTQRLPRLAITTGAQATPDPGSWRSGERSSRESACPGSAQSARGQAPLCAGGAARLLAGLRELEAQRPQTVGSEPRAGASGRALGSISRYGLRANERAAEADEEIASRGFQESQHYGGDSTEVIGGSSSSIASPPSGLAAGQLAMQDVTKSFQAIVASIDSALAGGDAAPVQVIRKGECIVDTVPMNNSRFFRVPLPSRPTAITVAVVRTGGAAATLWGSTSCERPSARNYDLKGKEDKLVYEHALAAAGDEEQEDPHHQGQALGMSGGRRGSSGHGGAPAVDRRHAVPPCRDLFVAVEADAGEASFKLAVSFSHISVKLSRQEIASQVQRVRQGWERRLADLQREPTIREQFEEHVQQLQQKKKKRLADLAAGANFVERNQTSGLKQATPRQRHLGLQKMALQGYDRHERAQMMKQDLVDEQERRHVAWMNRSEDKKREREELEIAQRTHEERLERQQRWLMELALMVFSHRVGSLYAKRKREYEMIHEKIISAGVINRLFTKTLCWRRRHQLYKNTIKFRVALLAYVRHSQPLMVHSAQPVVQSFLTTHAFHREAPSLASTLHWFRAKVVHIQRKFRQTMISQQAFVQLFTQVWNELQDDVLKDFGSEQSLEQNALAKHDMELMKGKEDLVVPRKSAMPAASRKSQRLRPSKTGHLEAKADETLPPPKYAVHHFLSEYIWKMMRSFPKRLKEWESKASDNQLNDDVAKVAGLASANDKKPKRVYMDRDELRMTVHARMQEWRDGKWVHLKVNRERHLRSSFDGWSDLVRRARLGLVSCDEGSRKIGHLLRPHADRQSSGAPTLSRTGSRLPSKSNAAPPQQRPPGSRGSSRHSSQSHGQPHASTMVDASAAAAKLAALDSGGRGSTSSQKLAASKETSMLQLSSAAADGESPARMRSPDLNEAGATVESLLSLPSEFGLQGAGP